MLLEKICDPNGTKSKSVDSPNKTASKPKREEESDSDSYSSDSEIDDEDLKEIRESNEAICQCVKSFLAQTRTHLPLCSEAYHAVQSDANSERSAYM